MPPENPERVVYEGAIAEVVMIAVPEQSVEFKIEGHDVKLVADSRYPRLKPGYRIYAVCEAARQGEAVVKGMLYCEWGGTIFDDEKALLLTDQGLPIGTRAVSRSH